MQDSSPAAGEEADSVDRDAVDDPDKEDDAGRDMVPADLHRSSPSLRMAAAISSAAQYPLPSSAGSRSGYRSATFAARSLPRRSASTRARAMGATSSGKTYP